MVVARPSRRNAWAEQTNTPVASSGVDGAFLHGCKFLLQFFHVRVLPAACLDIPDGFQSFLDTVGDRPFI